MASEYSDLFLVSVPNTGASFDREYYIASCHRYRLSVLVSFDANMNESVIFLFICLSCDIYFTINI
jgi:hypothetical protein